MRKNLIKWILQNRHLTYTAWKKLPRETRLSDYEAYQKGVSL